MSNEIASYKAIVRAVIKKITGNYNEDLEQEAYLKIWQNKEKRIAPQTEELLKYLGEGGL